MWFIIKSINNHFVMQSARISLTLPRHPSLSFIISGRSSGLYPVSSQSCCIQVRAGHPDFAQPCEGVHRSTSLMSSSLLLQQCPACLVHINKKTAQHVKCDIYIDSCNCSKWNAHRIWTWIGDFISCYNNLQDISAFIPQIHFMLNKLVAVNINSI